MDNPIFTAQRQNISWCLCWYSTELLQISYSCLWIRCWQGESAPSCPLTCPETWREKTKPSDDMRRRGRRRTRKKRRWCRAVRPTCCPAALLGSWVWPFLSPFPAFLSSVRTEHTFFFNFPFESSFRVHGCEQANDYCRMRQSRALMCMCTTDHFVINTRWNPRGRIKAASVSLHSY